MLKNASSSTTAPAALNESSWAPRLVALLEQQHDIVGQLAELAHAQAELIAQARTERLLELLTQRQELIDRFAEAQQQVTPMTAQLERKLNEVPHELAERIRSLIAEISHRLAGVMRRDEADQASLRSGQQQIKHELATLGTGKQARSAYAVAATGPARFADRRG